MKSFLRLLIIACVLPVMTYAGDPVAQITFRVTDDNGNIIPGAVVSTSTFLRWIPGSGAGHDEHDIAQGVTDTNGIVVIKMKSKDGNISYGVYGAEKSGRISVAQIDYYRDRGGTMLFKQVLDGKWQPWDPTVDIQIKRVINPIPMYARQIRIQSVTLPEQGKAIGFDLMKSDWVAPYGKGQDVDFLMRMDQKLEGMRDDGFQMHDTVFTLSFPNEKDGIQLLNVKPRQGSRLRLPHMAPENGYQSNVVKHSYLRKDASVDDWREDETYIFRVRTKTNELGKIASALYGKIQSPIEFGIKGQIKFTYYLNPTPNDRNLEFDPKQNLLKNLKSTEEVSEP